MSEKVQNRDRHVDPVELRGIFGENLRSLSRNYPSVAGLCRDLGINRTQFNRYLSGESFPRPDVLHRICNFFDVDARILLEPVENLSPISAGLLSHPEIAEYVGHGSTNLPETEFPSGFYRFSRRAFIDNSLYARGLLYVTRKDGYTLMRGFEPKKAMLHQGLKATKDAREFRGLVLRQEEGIAALVSHRHAMTCTYNFLSKVTSFQANFFEGYATRTVRESVTGRRATRMVYEHLGNQTGEILATARTAGICNREDLSPFHLRLLRPDEQFQ